MPGAGGLVVANYVAQRAARDGTEFAITSRTAAFEPLYGNTNAQFDPLKFNWVGNANIENSTCIAWSSAPVKTARDLFTTEFVNGGTGSESLEVSIPKVLNRLADTKIRTVTGYPGSTEILLALERGEVQGFCGIGWTFLKLRKAEWLREKKVNVLFQMAMAKHPDIPDVPLVQELGKTPEARAILDLLMAPQDMGRPFFAPQDTPADRLAALRDAFAKTLKDPDFLREADRSGVEVQYTTGEAVHAVLRKAYAAPPELVKRTVELLQ
jgi:tripartite-type tricarboxylate transporter receptor subunit TctC